MKAIGKTLVGVGAGLIVAAGLIGTAGAGMPGGYGMGPGMHGGGPGMHGGYAAGAEGRSHMRQRMAQHLDLTSAQSEQIEAIVAAHAPELKAMRQQIRVQRRTLAEATASGFDESAVRTEADALGALVADTTVLMSRMRSQISEVLTAEQREQMQARMQNRKPHARHHHTHPSS